MVQSLRPVMQSLPKHNCLFIRLATTFIIYMGDRLLLGRPLYPSSSRLSLEFLNLLYHSKTVERLKGSSFSLFCNICKVPLIIFPSLTCLYVVRLLWAPTWSRYAIKTTLLHLASHKHIAFCICNILQNNVSSLF